MDTVRSWIWVSFLMSSIGPLIAKTQVRTDRVRAFFDRMILSTSGWRTIFAADQEEESPTAEVLREHLVLISLAARAFVEAREGNRNDLIVVGTDSRPTGPLLARAAIRTLLHFGADVWYLGVAAAPEIMCYAATNHNASGFFYLSASHNPIGHNGIKLGDASGGVLGGEAMNTLISRYQALAADDHAIGEATALLAADAHPQAEAVHRRQRHYKKESLEMYAAFTRRVLAGSGPGAEAATAAFLDEISRRRPIIVGDLNGSARAATIDATFLATIGCKTYFFNDVPGEIDHQIVPEGAGLEPCRHVVERLARGLDPVVHQEKGVGEILGYVPDNDGDRGNLVYHESMKGARQMDAQTVFALACTAELCWLKATGGFDPAQGEPPPRVAVVVNGPTSMRIDRIASVFGVEVHRVEVGEANVVAKAAELRREGVLVRILGEGSNGGNITHPAAVRDPLNTILAVLKLLYARGVGGRNAPLHYWTHHDSEGDATENAGDPSGTQPSIAQIIDTLPTFTTTGAFESGAKMNIGAASHAEIKRNFESRFEQEYAEWRPILARELGVAQYEFINYEGTEERRGVGARSGNETGGFKVLFTDSARIGRAFLWMRGSKTEPVFRIMVDVEGDRPDLEQDLLDWLRSMVERALPKT